MAVPVPTRMDRPAPAAADAPAAAGLNLFSGLFVVFLFSALVNLLILASPIFIIQLYSRVLTSQSLETLFVLTLVVVVMLAFAAAFDLLRSIVMQRIANRIYVQLGEKVVEASLTSPMRDSNRLRPLQDVEALRRFLAGREILSFMDIPFTSIFILVLFLIHYLLGLTALFAALAMIVLALANDVLSSGPQKEARDGAGRSMEEFGAFSARASDLAAMGMIGPIVARWLRGQAAVIDALRRAGTRTTVLVGASRALRMTLQVFIMALATYLVLSDDLNPGMIIAASILVTRAVTPIEGVMEGSRQLGRARDAYRRLKALLAAAPRGARMRHRPQSGAVEAVNLAYVPPSAGPAQPALRGVSFKLEAGEIVGVVGPSGSGKSVLGRLVIGALEPTAGSVRIDGVDVKNCDRDVLGQSLGYLPQRPDALVGTLSENIARFGAPEPELVWQAIRLCGLEADLGRLPRRLETPMEAAAAELPPGVFKRVLLARAFYGQLRLVVLDEAAADLDMEGEQILIAALRSLQRDGATIVLISPRGNLTSVVDRLMVLKGGMIERFGSRNQAQQQPARRPMAMPGELRLLSD